MAYLGKALFQFSNSLKLDRTKQERWISEPLLVTYSLMDSLGTRSRVLRLIISNPLSARSNWYPPMTRVRLFEEFGVVAFLGRVVAIEPDYANQQLILTCRDFLDDVADRTVEAADSNGTHTAVTRSYIAQKILDEDTYKPTIGGDLDRTLIRRLQMVPSAYNETISRNYSQRGNFQTVSAGTGADYQFRGVKTGMEAIGELAAEDPQQDLMAFYYTPTPTDPSNANHTASPQQYPRTYWLDLTRTIVDGSTHFVTPQTAQDTTTPESADILYFGSNSKFDGLRYTFLSHGTSIEKGTYAGNLQWQFWSGTAWTGFTPTADAKFSVDSGKLYGTTYWTVSNLTNWGKRDLGTTPDMHTANDATLNWAAPWASSGTTLPEDVHSAAISRIDHGDDRRNTNRYWVRVYVRTGSITVGKVNTVELYTKPNLFHDFRCEDPAYFSEVWRYNHDAAGSGWSTGRDGPGGTWEAVNMTGGNVGNGRRLLWNNADHQTTFIPNATTTWYFGSEYPFNGVEFHALQAISPDYSNVKFVWQFYSAWNGYAYSEPWQTISGLTIASNTVANPTVITTERHNLSTGDSVTISNSNASPSLNGTHTVTYISDTTFSIPINVTIAGTAGHVVCNNRITVSEAMGATGDAAWALDTGASDVSNDYYLNVRWDTDNFYAADTFVGTDFEVAQVEFNKLHMQDDYPYSDMVSGKGARIQKWTTGVGTNSISAANPTVVTSAATAGGSTVNHNVETGDKVFIRGSNSTPSVDGLHTITKISANTFSIPVNVTNAGNTGTLSVFTPPPSSRVLYWVRCYIVSGTPTEAAMLRDVKTAPVGIFKYFDRGKEPWVYNANTTVQGTTATKDIQYCYRYDTSASAGSKFTDYSQEISSTTSGTSLRVVSNTLANPTVVTTDGASLTISANTVAAATVITTSAAHGMATDDTVVITGSNSTPSINGTFAVTVLSTTTFSITVRVTSAGSAGTAVPVVLHGLTTGHKVVITGSNSTPTINGTRTVTVLSNTTFSIPVNVTTAGTAGTVVPEKVYAMDNGQIGDAIYIGMDEPFSALRLNVTDVLSSSSTGQSGIIWQFFKGVTLDDWTTITQFDETGDFTASGIGEITFDKPFDWKTCQPGIKEANGTDQSFGKTAYYVRGIINATSGTPATSAAKISQGFVGPNLWNPGMEVGTISGVTSVRHSDPATYGLSLNEYEHSGDQSQTIAAYSLNDKPIEFVNKVSVRGRSGAYGVAEDATSIATYGLVKERMIDDSTLTNSLQCETRARAILEQFKPGPTSSFRECKIKIMNPPVYSVLNRPSFLRAGDRVNVTINTEGIIDEIWLVYSIFCQYGENAGWECNLILFRDMTSVVEAGSAERRLIRDLVARSRETANAIFQPLDKAVVSGLDFLPEGPGRAVGREEYGPLGTELNILPENGSTVGDYADEFRWTKKLYSNHQTRETLDKDLMRIDHLGITASEDGVASGGAGLGFIARDKRTSSGTPDFHPGTDEATLYLRNSGTVTEGSGLYIAHRDIFNSGSTYEMWNRDTPKINAEVMVGFTGFVSHANLDSSGNFNIVLPALDSAPLVFANVCGHEAGSSGSAGNWTNATCTVNRWTTSSGKYTNVQMHVTAYANNLTTDVTGGATADSTLSGQASSGYYDISAITAANPTVITIPYSLPNGRPVWIGESNSTPTINGLYSLDNRVGSGPYTYDLVSFNTSVFPVAVTVAGTAGKLLSMSHLHSFGSASAHSHVVNNHTHGYDQAGNWNYASGGGGIGIMYAVVYNSGKNTTGLNSHFSQNHVSHP
jgi:hypothetical protein